MVAPREKLLRDGAFVGPMLVERELNSHGQETSSLVKIAYARVRHPCPGSLYQEARSA